MITAKSEILRVLSSVGGEALAVHELKRHLPSYSENSLATRVSELHAEGEVVGRKRLGKPYKEWKRSTVIEKSWALDAARMARVGRPADAARVVAFGPVDPSDAFLGPEQEMVVTVKMTRSQWDRFSKSRMMRLSR